MLFAILHVRSQRIATDKSLRNPSLHMTIYPIQCFSSMSKDLSFYQKVKKWLQPFVTGSKSLYHENKQALALRYRIYESQEKIHLTRRELLLLRQAHRDLFKSLPLLAFFCVPLLGYAAPLLGYQFLKQLLPSQFWRPNQKTQFLQEDVEARAMTYPQLVQLLLQIQYKDDTLREMLARAKTKGNEGLRPDHLVKLMPFFDGPAALAELSDQHIYVLAEGSVLFPAFALLNKLLRKSQVQKKLERRALELSLDDQELLKEGVDSLSLSELEFACHERGIVTQYGKIETLRDALKKWLSMYDTDHFDPVSNPQRLPSSLVLHAPALACFAKLEQDENTTV